MENIDLIKFLFVGVIGVFVGLIVGVLRRSDMDPEFELEFARLKDAVGLHSLKRTPDGFYRRGSVTSINGGYWHFWVSNEVTGCVYEIIEKRELPERYEKVGDLIFRVRLGLWVEGQQILYKRHYGKVIQRLPGGHVRIRVNKIRGGSMIKTVTADSLAPC